jgi:hypothetical protein
MPLTFASPLAVLTAVFFSLVALSHTEPALERLCAEQMVRNGFTQVQSLNRCTRF